jgi:DNA-binding transcriptional MocR family regulator
MSDRRTLLLTRRAVRVKGRRVIARFLLQPGRAAVITLPTHNDARRAAQRLIVQLRLTKTDEEWDDLLTFRVELIRAMYTIGEGSEEEGEE